MPRITMTIMVVVLSWQHGIHPQHCHHHHHHQSKPTFFLLLLKRRSLGRLTQSPVLIRTHFHPNRLQNLFDPHVSVPVSHRRQFFGFEGTGSRFDAIHVDLGNETDLRGDGGVLFGTMNAQLIKAAVVVGAGRAKDATVPVRQKGIARVDQAEGNGHISQSLFALFKFFEELEVPWYDYCFSCGGLLHDDDG
mmetsp:Transcript_2778/g.3951  ORF Transcript_2778/g.3951 Transcript_2778/m.3951 type:complete len:192 (-) Transcript_2778:57-632(-)